MNLENVPKELIAKIQKLLKLQESAENIGSIEEAANAAGKISDLLAKHNLDLFQIRAAGDHTTKEAPVQHSTYDPETLTKPHEGKWVTLLTSTIARYNGVTVLHNRGGVTALFLIGTAVNVEITWYTIEQLTERLRMMAKENFRKYEGKEKRNTYIRGYYLGAVSGIQAQLAENAAKEVYNAKVAAEKRATHSSMDSFDITALQVIDMKTQLMKRNSDFIAQKFGRIGTTSTSTRSKSVGGRTQGYSDGKSINIHSGVGAGNPSSTKRLN